ncbi:copper amine oxidase N-terminal domain-containing protein [Paenibacillus mendelii]|uniref:Copper amine oxidase N-terminal domain-containing protein n=1 Tax=Paenibacillus mendelii TaxID=206163 RepID=A0ABV6J8X3_9BACL|nr:copper amine oxidase N-terminal domain-containing protein [Paenibacillus mendelii]MCQ6559678.1 copper amine oxidase N-terminal domain-containing protein [Paenibacillus mendelii]
MKKVLKWKNKLKMLVALSVLASAITVVPSAGEAAKSERKIVSSDMPVKVLYNARQVASDVKPKVVEGAVLVPIRFIGEKIGSEITISNNNKNIHIKRGSNVANVTIGSKVATVNGKTVTLNAAVIAENGRTLVPIQVVGGLGVAVEWDSITKFVWVGHKNVPMLEDVAPKAVPLTPYSKYFKGNEYLLELNGEKRDAAIVITDSIFPFKTSEGRTYFRYDLANDNHGDQYIKATTTDKGIMVTPIYFMGQNNLLLRSSIMNMRVDLEKDLRIHYYPVVSITDFHYYDDKNYANLKIGDIKNIYIHTEYPSLLILASNWR